MAFPRLGVLFCSCGCSVLVGQGAMKAPKQRNAAGEADPKTFDRDVGHIAGSITCTGARISSQLFGYHRESIESRSCLTSLL